MFASIRISGPALRLSVLSVALLPFVGLSSHAAAQTVAPQLLPYQIQALAGGGTTAITAGSACAHTGAVASGYTAYDTFSDGCLASEVFLSNPKASIVDSTGAVYFTDYTSANVGVVHRIDPATGITTAIAGGVTTTAAAGASCSTTTSSDHNNVTAGDVFGDGCLATSVKLQRPTGLAFSPAGDLYIVDEYSYNVRKVSMHNGGVAAVAIINGGASYATAPTVTFSAPPAGGTLATGTAVISSGGVVTSVTITNSGSGYTSAPTVTFSVPGTGTNTATGSSVFAGVISTLVGSNGGTSTTAHGYGAATGCGAAATSTTPCVLDAVYGIAVDAAGNVYLSDEFYNAILVLNPNTADTTVLGVSIPAGTMQLVTGYRASGCTNGTASTNGCAFGTYVNGVSALASTSMLDNPYGIALDSYGNVYFTDYYYGNIGQVSAGAHLPNAATGTSGYLAGNVVSSPASSGFINSYAGSTVVTASHTYAKPAATTRGIAATFNIGADYGVGIETANNDNNLYIADTTNGYIWRVDGATQTMYVLAGGGNGNAAYTVGAACAGTPANVSATALDKFGDGCPATSATFFSGTTANLFGVSADTNSNVYVTDTYNYLYRKIATGTNFGNTGATQTDYLDVHFAAGDMPVTTGTKYAITSGSTIFTIGTVTCTTNTDTNANFGNSTDCIIPITASPTVTGPYTGTLTVYSTKVPAGTAFPLAGNFIQSPITQTSVSVSGASTCNTSSGVYPTTTAETLKAVLVANGPSAPTGNIIFSANGTALAPTTGVAVTNLGTSASPVYGATLNYTFSTPNTYTITAQYVPTTGSYFSGSTSSGVSVTSSAPSITTTLNTGALSTVTHGGTALYSFTLGSNLFSGTISFSCSGLPANSACVFDPPSITATGCSTSNTIALSIYTQAGTVSSPAGFDGTGSGPWRMVGIFFGFVMAMLIGVSRRRIPLRSGQLMLLIALLLAASGLTACSKPVGTPLVPATPTFNGNVTVTATGSDGTTSSFTVPLQVR